LESEPGCCAVAGADGTERGCALRPAELSV
jgi:hypothetical protein